MDVLTGWKEFKEDSAHSQNDASLFNRYISFLNKYVFGPDSKYNFSIRNLNVKDKKSIHKAIYCLTKGKLVEIGGLSQLEAALCASLYFIAQSKRVFIFTWKPIDPSYSELFSSFREELGITVGIIEQAMGKAARLAMYQNELVITEQIQFVKDFHTHRNSLIPQKDSVAIICDADLCLYDRRIFFFDNAVLKAIAAIYRATVKKAPSNTAQEAIVDFKEITAYFSRVGGVTSRIAKDVKREIRKVYGIQVKTVKSPVQDGHLPAVIFKTRQEKFSALCEDISRLTSDALVFCYSDVTLDAMVNECKKKGCEAVQINTGLDFSNFFKERKDKKVVGLIRGFADVDLSLASAKKVAVFLAEHFPFLNHHLKIKVFCRERLSSRVMPQLYMSLEDEAARIYTEGADFSRSFALIEAIEKKYSTRWMRSRIAAGILRNIYRMRGYFWNETSPVMTTVFIPIPAGVNKSSHLKKEIGKRFTSLCFCGSGREFKDCHGKGLMK